MRFGTPEEQGEEGGAISGSMQLLLSYMLMAGSSHVEQEQVYGGLRSSTLKVTVNFFKDTRYLVFPPGASHDGMHPHGQSKKKR